MTEQILRRQATFPDLPAAAASLIEPLLLEAAGQGAEPVSLTLDFGSPIRAGDSVVVEAGVDRATRTLVFAYGKLTTPEGLVVATGSAVFRRLTDITKAA